MIWHWNHDHIVEENTKRRVYELNAVWGYETPLIVSPIHLLRGLRSKPVSEANRGDKFEKKS